MIDQGFAQAHSTVQDVNDGNAAFGPLQCIAQSARRIEGDRDAFETTCSTRRAQRITAGRLADTTF